jgi:ABC-2 type transport system ATP-binding protein
VRDERGGDAGTAILVEGLVKRYGRTLALDGVSLEVPAGSHVALLGPNGAGKSTLIGILSTTIHRDGGRALVAGVDVALRPRQARRHIGVVFQDPTLDGRLTVQENLAFHAMVYGVPRAERAGRIAEALELVELGGWSDRLARALSSGMKRRLEIARALVHRPRVLILDEPTAGLDPQSRARIWSYLAALRESHALTLLVTTHYIEEVEHCDRVCVIDHGRVLAEGSPDALKAEYGQEVIRVWPRSEAEGMRIRAAYPDARDAGDGSLALPVTSAGLVDAFLGRFGTGVRQIRFEQPNLEGVFLSLTGRGLRDREADARDVTLAFGRQGGEHTG